MLRSLLLLAFFSLIAGSISAEEIEIITCDVLPMVEVRVSGLKFRFLVDTAATSILNIKSFAFGETRTIPVTSWNGTTDTEAKQVWISDLTLGDRHFHNLRLPAVDLSGISRACGRQIDGILGIDLLRKVGAVVDLRDHTPRLRIETETIQDRVQDLKERIGICEEGLNRDDETAISDCLDPEIVVFTWAGDFHGRTAFVEFFRKWYSSQQLARLSLKTCFYHVLGEAIWMEFYSLAKVGENTITSHGTALWSNTDGKWRVVHLNLGGPHNDAVAVSSH